MSEKALEEMEPSEFASIADDTIEQLLRQLGPDDALACQMLTRVKAEIRRRILEPAKMINVGPITVEVERKDAGELVFSSGFVDGNFHATPYVITLVEPGEPQQDAALTHVFFSAAEADGFLAGLRAARLLGLPFESIPYIEDVSEGPADGDGGGTD